MPVIFVSLNGLPITVMKLVQSAISKTCENWLFLVNNRVYYARQTRDIYQVLPYSLDFKAPIEIHWARQYLVNAVLYGIKDL